MKTKKIALVLACCTPFIGSCAMQQKVANNETWRVEPLYSVNNTKQSPDSLYQLGRYYQGQQRYEQALNAYRRAIAADPSFVEAHNGLGVVFAMQGRYDDAITAFRTAISNDTTNAVHLYNNLGRALYLQGSYVDAIYALEVAAALDPNNARARENLAQAYAQAKATGKLPAELAALQESPTTSTGDILPENTTAGSIDISAALAAIEPIGEPAATFDSPAASVAENAAGYTATPATAVKSRIETVQVSSNVYELRERASPAKLATAEVVPQPQPVSASTVPMRLEVSNGNGVTGFAKRIGSALKDYGFPTARLTNQKPFNVAISQIQYRSGFRDEAQRLQSTLPGKTELIQTDKLRQDIQARLLLGKDMVAKVAQLESPIQPIQMASSDAAKGVVK